MKLLKPINMEEINECVKLQQNIRNQASASKNWGSELELFDFIKAMACLHPQSSGGRIEDKLSNIIGLVKTDDLNRGDRKSIKGEYFELKGSFLTSSNSNLNLVQIRPWQDVNYIFYLFDIRDLLNNKMQLFFLKRNQLELEMNKCKVSSAHGTKDCNIVNLKKELALRIKIKSETYNQWVINYGISLDNLISLINL